MPRVSVFLLLVCSAAWSQSFSGGVAYPVQHAPLATVSADFNGDGRPDLAVSNGGSSNVSIFFGNSDGSFTAGPTVAIPGSCPVGDLAAGDFNGDGKADVFATCSFQTTVWLLPGLGNGQFGAPISTATPAVEWDGFIGTCINGIAAADFNRDGKLDIALIESSDPGTSTSGSDVYILFGNSNGAFSVGAAIPIPISYGGSTIVAADFNNDGMADLAIADTHLAKNSDASQLLILRGDGQGSFTQANVIQPQGIPLAGTFIVADVNGDNKPDIVMVTATVASTSVQQSALTSYLGNGDFTFRTTTTVFEDDQVGALVPGNFRGTGTIDLVEEILSFSTTGVTDLNSLSLMIRAGNGDGTFQNPLKIAMPAGLSPLALHLVAGDWNGDGLPDLAFTASPSSIDFGISLNTGTPIAAVPAAYDAMPAGDLVVMLNALTPPPAISLSKTQLQFSAAAGSASPAAQTVALSNGGGGTLAWTAASTVSWLTVSPKSGSGSATLSITVAPGSMAAGPYTGAIQISATGAGNTPQTISVTLVVTAASTRPQITSVVNGASFLPGIESGSWVTIYGTNLSNTNPGRIWLPSEVVNGNLPKSLDGTSVTIDGIDAYVYYISPTQINVQAPTDSATGAVNVVVTNNGQTSTAVPAQLQTYAPAFFLYGNTSYAIASHYPDYALVGNPSVIPGTIAAHPGDILILWATGFGPTSPATPAGIAVTGVPAAVTTPLITIGEVQVGVIGTAVLTAQTAGLYQVAVQLPASMPTGVLQVVASLSGTQSPTGILIYVAAQ